MNIVGLDGLRPGIGRAAKFEGYNYEAQTSFFVVNSPPGLGVNKHRHPYEETLIILDADIDILVGEELKRVKSGNAIIVPPDTWHAFTNKSDHNALMVTIHASPKIIQEDWKG
jgi:quercetin dioxygenase-like cupin family protein